MDISPSDATAALDDVERIVQRVKQSAIYRKASTLLILWGALVACAYAGSYLAPQSAGAIWLTEQVVGFVATGLLVWSSRRAQEGPLDLRFFGVWALILGFGLLWTVVFNTFDARSANAFWATLFMFVYAVAGLWLGRGFLILGLAITALTVAGFFWAGAAFSLYMALVNGGGMIVCGLWMRRA